MKRRFQLIKKQTSDIVYFGIVARILIFIKGILIAYQIGSNYNTDIYFLALSSSLLLTSVIGDGLAVSLIPVLQQVDKRDGMKGRLEFTNNTINNSIFLSIIFIVLGFIGAPLIISLMGPGFKGMEFQQTVRLFRIGLPIISINFIRAICAGYLQSQHLFKAGAKGAVVNNLIYIAYLSLFSHKFGLEGLMITGLIAMIGQLVVSFRAMIKGGYKYSFEYHYKSRTLQRLIGFLVPISIGIGINEINTAVDNAIGSSLPSGTIGFLNYANNIIQLILGLFVLAIVSAIFPVLTESFNKKLESDLNGNIRFGFKIISLITIPVSIIFIILAELIIKLVYERGGFTHSSTILTADILKLYAIGLIGMGLLLLIIRIYYAIHDTVTPMKISLIALPLNAILSIILVQFIGANGLALGTSLSVLITAFIGIYDLNRKLKLFENMKLAKGILKIVIAGSLMALLIIFVKDNLGPILNNSFGEELALLFLSAGVGLSTFWIILNKFKVID